MQGSEKVLQVDHALQHLLDLAAVVTNTSVESLCSAGYIVVLLEGDVMIAGNDHFVLCGIICQPLAERLNLLKLTSVGEVSCHQEFLQVQHILEN